MKRRVYLRDILGRYRDLNLDNNIVNSFLEYFVLKINYPSWLFQEVFFLVLKPSFKDFLHFELVR